MLSGKDLSEVGVFSYTYKDSTGTTKISDSSRIQVPLVWDYLGEQKKKTIALYVPLSYPVKPITGVMVSDFLTPGMNSNCAYPERIKEKLKEYGTMYGPPDEKGNIEFLFDVAVGLAGHKGMEVGKLIEKTYELTEMQLALLKDLLKNEDWDFFMTVMIGSDRLQHMLWNHFDTNHRKFIPNSPHKDALKNYYVYLDKQLGEIIKQLDERTTIIVTSDHGIIRQEGKINLNNWLIQEGYMALNKGIDPKAKARFSLSMVDLKKSVAHGSGAYHGRVYINKESRGKTDK